MTPEVRPSGALLRTLTLLLGLLFFMQSANAACSNPTGNAGDMTYSTSANVMAYCDSTNWISMAGGVSLTVNTTGGGTATPAGSANDVQFNDGTNLAADTGNFTYSSGLLKAPNISTTAITATGAGTFGTINSSGLGTLGSLIVTGGATITGQASITTISTSLIQIGTGNGAACTSSLAGAERYSTTSSTLEYCNGNNWSTLGPSGTAYILKTMSGDMASVAVGNTLTFATTYSQMGSDITASGNQITLAPSYSYMLRANARLLASTSSIADYKIYDVTHSAYVGPTGSANLGSNSDTPAIAFVTPATATTYEVRVAGVAGSPGITSNGSTFYAIKLGGGGSGSGGTATPAGSTNDVQFNSGGLLAADTGNFTYASSTLKTPSLLTGGITATGQASLTTVSSTLVQLISNTTTACTSNLAGAQRYNGVSNTIDYCTGTGWMSLGPSSTLPVAFMVTKGGTDQTIATNSHVKLTFSTKEFDTNNSFNTSTSRFTVTVPGVYLINASVTCSGAATNCQAEIFKNGTFNKLAITQNSTSGTGTSQASALMYLAAGDYIEGGVWSTAATTVIGTAYDTYLDAVLISASSGSGGGTATPAGSTNDVQFNSGGLLAADTGNFTYASSTLHAPSVLTGGITATGQASLTTVSSTLVQLISNTTTACTSNLAGAQRYNSTSNTIDYCSGTAWLSLGPSSTQPVAFSVTKGGTNQTITANSFLKMTWSTKELDTNNNFSACTTGCASGAQNATESRFTATVPGKYFLYASVNCPTATTCAVGLFKNGSEIRESPVYASTNQVPNVSVITDMSVGDYIEVKGWSGDGSIGGTTRTSSFAGALLSPQGSGSGTATPAGSTADVQFNTGGLLDADTGNFYWDKTNHRLGIGTNTPAAALQVSGGLIVSTTGQNSLASASFAVDSRGVSVSSVLHMGGYAISPIGAGGNAILSGTTAVSTSSAGSITMYTSGAQRMLIDTNGNVAIGGNANANGKLQVMQPSQGSLGLIIGNSTYSTTAFNAMGMQINDSGQAIIRGGWSTAKDIILNDNGGSVLVGYASGLPNPGVGFVSDGSLLLGKHNSASGTWYTGFYYNGTAIGSIAQNGTTAVAFNTTSDRRVKENIKDSREGLQKLMEIGVKDFSFKADPSHTLVNGFIAQDLDKVYPEAVTTNGDNGEVPLKDTKHIWQVDYGRVTPLIVKAVQDLKHLFDADHDQVVKLKAANDNLAHRVDELQEELEKMKAAR